ncbi:MAG: DUF5615 family PIN-like protein [Pirellulales bacterium]|nr:DUF5615 family PIN-like protein [Pirellulales bacterium]
MALFKLDENLPVEATELFQAAGHDALSVLDQALGGHPDDILAAICQQEQRAIVTFDLDFSNIRTYPPEEYFGIVVLRLEHQEKSHVLEILGQLILKLYDEPLAGKLWIVGETSVRIRG